MGSFVRGGLMQPEILSTPLLFRCRLAAGDLPKELVTYWGLWLFRLFSHSCTNPLFLPPAGQAYSALYHRSLAKQIRHNAFATFWKLTGSKSRRRRYLSSFHSQSTMKCQEWILWGIYIYIFILIFAFAKSYMHTCPLVLKFV